MQDQIFQSGAAIDTRPESAKQKDYRSEEVIASFAPVNWKEKPQSTWRRFPIFNQDGSGSCVAQTEAKEIGIMRWLKDGTYIHFSATDIYQRRSNKPQGGMIANNAREIAREGVTLEALAPSQNMSDAQMDAVVIEAYKRQVGAVFAIPNFLSDPLKDVDAIASIIQQTGKGVMVWYYFANDEWVDRPVVKYPGLDLYAASTARHSVTAVDFTLINGKKCLIIEDSWGPGHGMGGQRIIDEDFHRARNWHASHLMAFKFDDQTQPQPQPEPQPNPAPHHVFLRNLAFSPTFSTDEDVRALQNILKYEGLFPANTDSTGYYGAITAKGVLAWQKKHAVDTPQELDRLQGKYVGPKTRNKLNSIYGQ